MDIWISTPWKFKIVPEDLSSQKEKTMLNFGGVFPVQSIVCPTIYDDHRFGRYFFRITRHTIWVDIFPKTNGKWWLGSEEFWVFSCDQVWNLGGFLGFMSFQFFYHPSIMVKFTLLFFGENVNSVSQEVTAQLAPAKITGWKLEDDISLWDSPYLQRLNCC